MATSIFNLHLLLRLRLSELWGAHSAQVQTLNNTMGTPSFNNTANAIALLQEYSFQVIPAIDTDPIERWRTKATHGRLNKFLPVIKKFLIVPATSVPSEQLFSKAGDLISKKRSLLSGSLVNKLLFICYNA